MNHFWIPESAPPQLSISSADALKKKLDTNGADYTIGAAMRLLEKEDRLMVFVDMLGLELNDGSSEGPWPSRVLKAGAALTLLAYRSDGHKAIIDDRAMEFGHMTADLNGGVPTAYVEKLYEDSQLLGVTKTALNSQLFVEPSQRHSGGYAQVADIGSGCTRLYLQQAIALAA